MNLRDAVSSRVHRAVAGRGLDDAVDCALDRVVAPPGEKIARVDHASVFNRGRVDEGTRRTLNLQSTSGKRSQRAHMEWSEGCQIAIPRMARRYQTCWWISYS